MNIVEQPQTISLTGNRMTYIITSAYYQNLHSHYIHVKVQTFDGSAWNDVEGAEDAVAVNNQKATFDISTYLEKVLSPQFVYPDHYTNLIIPQSSMSVQYRIVYWERLYDTVNDTWYTSTTANSADRYAVKGGISDISRVILNEANSDFYNYFLENKKFMTFTPDEKVTYPESVEKLYWIARQTATVQLAIYYKKVGNVNIYNITQSIAMTLGEMYEISVSPHIVEEYAEADVEYFTVELTDVSETKKYIVDRSHYERKDHLIFQNSLGVFETFTVVGNRSLDVSFSRQVTLQRLNNYHYFLDNGSRRMNLQSLSKVYTSNSGILDKEMYDFLMMLMSSERMWHIKNSMPIPAMIITDSVRFDNDDEDLFSITFEWGPAFGSKYHDAIAAVAENILPPYWDKVDAYFLRYQDSQYVDIKNGYIAEAGQDIVFPEIVGNDIFDLSDAAYWDNTDAAVTNWYDLNNPRSFYIEAWIGTTLAGAMSATTHARLFFKDYNGETLKSAIPIIAYGQDLTEAEQQVVIDWLDWYITIFTADGSVVETSDFKTLTTDKF